MNKLAKTTWAGLLLVAATAFFVAVSDLGSRSRPRTPASDSKGGTASVIHRASAVIPSMAPAAAESLANGVEFTDLEAQMREFVGYDESIRLTPEQDAIKTAVLSRQAAVCCRSSSALTCCCPCNLSKSLWGLANYVIANKGFDEARLEAALADWMTFTNPSGYTGDACYTGGCERAPRNNGCGGMDALVAS